MQSCPDSQTFSALGSSWVPLLLGTVARARRGARSARQYLGWGGGGGLSSWAAPARLGQQWWRWGLCLSQGLASRDGNSGSGRVVPRQQLEEVQGGKAVVVWGNNCGLISRLEGPVSWAVEGQPCSSSA